ncbi:hypothetical protein KFE19_14430 [Dysosmobacter sp. Marseille-Q4140]|nr:hypothetical protein KFE19_14430 [Dysosmobacter sp. Marseille-Q4140]
MNMERGKLVTKDGWVMCPVCGKGKILKVNPDTTVHNLPRPCKRCGQISIVNIEAPEPESSETSA